MYPTEVAQELITSKATDEDRLQVLIHLVADLSKRVDELASRPPQYVPEPRLGPREIDPEVQQEAIDHILEAVKEQLVKK
jgi:hypothetical protein